MAGFWISQFWLELGFRDGFFMMGGGGILWQLLVDLAKARNSIPLPKIIGGYGISLPPEVDTLIYPNYQLNVPTRTSFADMDNDIEWEDDDDKEETVKEAAQPTQLQDSGRKVSFSIAGKGPKA
jgi:hypothetical protein